jgi:hypothetical protein
MELLTPLIVEALSGLPLRAIVSKELCHVQAVGKDLGVERLHHDAAGPDPPCDHHGHGSRWGHVGGPPRDHGALLKGKAAPTGYR